VNQVEVFLDTVKVGEIERFGDQFERHVFRFDADWLRLVQRPVLGQLFEDRLPRPIETDGLTPWFEHLLPPSGSPLRRAIARDAQVDDEDGLALLAWLGEELPGAVRVRAKTSVVPYRRGPVQLPLPESLSPFRMSLAGNQWKLSLRSVNDNFVIPLTGSGEWIAKFHGSEFPHLAGVEFATMTWASQSGLAVPRIKLVPCDDIAELPPELPRGDGYAFVIERFDWLPTGRVHVEDFGQIFDKPPGQPQFSESYEALAAFFSSESPADLDSLIDRLAFMVLSGNADAHLKNWVVSYPDRRHLRLAPCFDLVSTIVYPRLGRTLALKLNRSADVGFDQVTLASFDHVAALTGRSNTEVRHRVEALAAKARAAWKDIKPLLLASHQAALERHLSAVQL